MYNPEDIDNFQLLSAYLRTNLLHLNKTVLGTRGILDFEYNNIINLDDVKDLKEIDLLYNKYFIPKKNQKLGYRIVYELQDQFAIDILKNIKFNLTDLYKPHDCAHGFVQKRNVLTNARQHLGKKYLLSLDLKNYFETITSEKVENAFLILGFKPEISKALAKMTTLSGVLIQGLSTSPIIANIVTEKMDNELNSLCIKNTSTYTRYADDISISSNYDLPKINEIREIIEKNGFTLNDKKTKRFKRGQNQFVTGLTVFDSLCPRIPKTIKKKIRQELYYIEKYGYHSHVFKIWGNSPSFDESIINGLISGLRNNLKGWIDYIHSIEPNVAKIFYEKFNNIEFKEIGKRKAMLENYSKNNDGIPIIITVHNTHLNLNKSKNK